MYSSIDTGGVGYFCATHHPHAALRRILPEQRIGARLFRVAQLLVVVQIRQRGPVH